MCGVVAERVAVLHVFEFGCLCCWGYKTLKLLFICTADESKTVDLYNNVTNAWGTATLNVARKYLAATSVCNVALFAGGVHDGVLISFGSVTARA